MWWNTLTKGKIASLLWIVLDIFPVSDVLLKDPWMISHYPALQVIRSQFQIFI